MIHSCVHLGRGGLVHLIENEIGGTCSIPSAIGPRNVSQDVPGHRIYPIGRNPISRKRIPNDTGEVVRIPPCRQRIIDRYQISCRVEEIREIPLSLS